MGRLNKCLERVKNFKKDQWLIVILAGVLLFIIVLPTEKKEKKKEEVKEGAITGNTSTEVKRDYGEYLEQKLEALLGQMDGVGKVKVMITLADTGEEILERDERQSRTETKEENGDSSRTATEVDLEYTTIFIEEGGVKTPYVVRKRNPEVEGVVVLAEGGGNSVTAQNISKVVGALFSVETHKIMIMKME